MIIDLKLNLQSEKELLQTRPGYGVIFIKVDDADVRSIDFFSASDGTLPTATFRPSADLHEWIDIQYRESQEKGKRRYQKMKDKEEKYYTRLECTFVDDVAIAKVIREDKIAIKHFWNVAEEVSK